MTTYEIIAVIVSFLGIIVGIFKVWSKTQTDIAMINVNIKSLESKIDSHGQDLAAQKLETDKRFEKMHRDNREVFQRVFDRLDVIADRLGGKK